MVAHFQEYLEEIKPRLDDALQKEVSLLFAGMPLNDRLPLMGLNTGKKIRGGLSCMICHALGGSLETAIPGAVAIELIHAATLIHDDFIDQDVVRRNRPAVWTMEGARRAVLIGDVIFAAMIKKMSDCGREEGRTVSHAIAQVSMGALHEATDPSALADELESGHVGGRLYERIIHLKTGVLFGAACRLGSIAAGAGVHLKETCYQYGVRMGEAYQIADDIKDLLDHQRRQGITPGQMALLAPALLHFAEEMRPFLLNLLRGKATEFDEATLERISLAVRRMETDIKHRLKTAVSEIERDLPKTEYNELARQTPWDLITMFNQSE